MTNRRRFEVKRKVVEYLGGRCIRCGYDKSFVALQAHHRDPGTKRFTISGSHSRSWESIRKELDKCDLLCGNCHAEIEYDGAVYPV